MSSEETNARFSEDELWQTVAAELAKGDSAADKIAVIEAEKIFQQVLDEKELPGHNAEDRLRDSARLFTNPDKLRYSRAMYGKIVHKLDFDISGEDAREIIKGYHEAIHDLLRLDLRALPLRERIGLLLRRHFSGLGDKAKVLLRDLGILSLSAFILTETARGRALGNALLGINNYFYLKIVPLVFFLAALLLIALGIFYARQGKRQ